MPQPPGFQDPRKRRAIDRGVTLATLAFPVLVAVHAPLSLLAVNVDEVAWSEAVRAIVVLASAALFSVVVLGIVLRSEAKAALSAGVAWVVFLSYGHMYNVLKGASLGGLLIGRHRYLAPLFVAIAAVAVVAIARRRTLEVRFAAGAGLIALALVGAAAAPLLSYYWPKAPPPATHSEVPQASGLETRFPEGLPDIYYVIADAHGRADTLQAFYGYDSAEFVAELERLGLFVASRSLSNYSQTALSLGSTLNMRYLDDLVESLGPDSEDRRPARQLVVDNEVLRLAKSLGYTVVVAETALLWEQFSQADRILTPDYVQSRQETALLSGIGLNLFEGMLIETTIGRVWFDWYVQEQARAAGGSTFDYWKHRERILFQFEVLAEPPAAEPPRFVLIHIMAPHAPFVFGSRGEEIPSERAFTLLDGGCCSEEEYFRRLPEQIAFVDRLLLQSVADLLKKSERPPIIVIQGDHGPAGYVYGRTAADFGRLDRMAILNAYYLPQACGSPAYPEITPVNTFRLIFRECFGLPYEPMPDVSYFSEYEAPYRLIPVTNLDLP